MSLKVYDGYRASSSLPFDQKLRGIVDEILRITPKIVECQVKLASCLYASKAVELMDRGYLGLPQDVSDPSQTPIDIVRANARSAQDEVMARGYRSSRYDWGCQVALYRVVEDNELLLRVMTEQKAYTQLIEHTMMPDHLERFWYDGGVDHHGIIQNGVELNEEDWQKRAVLWGKTAKPQLVLGNTPVVYTLLTTSGPLIEDVDIVKHQPSYEDRLDTMADIMAAHQYDRRHPIRPENYKKSDTSIFVRHIYARIEWLNTPDGEDEIEVQRAKASQFLPLSYQHHDFQQPLTTKVRGPVAVPAP
jgi:hypothetical protein